LQQLGDADFVNEQGIRLMAVEPLAENIHAHLVAFHHERRALFLGRALPLIIKCCRRPLTADDGVVAQWRDEARSSIAQRAHLLESELHIVKAVQLRTIHGQHVKVRAEADHAEVAHVQAARLIIALGEAKDDTANATRD